MNTTLCILCTLLLGIIFRWAALYKLPAIPIVIVNYLTCTVIGYYYISSESISNFKGVLVPASVILGLLFFIGFSLFAITIKKAGLSLAVLFQKLSLILSVPFAVFWGDQLTFAQYLGIGLACIAIFLILKPKGQSKAGSSQVIFLLLGCLLVSAAIECTFIFSQKKTHWDTQAAIQFTTYIFAIAFVVGFIYMLICKREYLKLFQWKIISIGILLGIPNFHSIYFMLKALNSEFIPSIFYTLLNSSIIILSSIVAYFCFRDPLSKNQWLGLCIAIFSLALITLANLF
ncbi:MAG: hypothetical protein IPM92_07395 [Saprospiraceae bacterium]|nr:hypothetical protein [Saprospiraceae bacterium]